MYLCTHIFGCCKLSCRQTVYKSFELVQMTLHDKLLESHGTFYNLNVLLDSASTILIFRLRTQPDAQERVATPAQAVRDPIC
jgi:hypothetical protein